MARRRRQRTSPFYRPMPLPGLAACHSKLIYTYVYIYIYI